MFQVGSAARQMMTGRDNLTVDLFRILAAASVAVGLALECVSVLVPGHPFDIQGFGIGIGSLLGAAGLALKLKADTEPDVEGVMVVRESSTTSVSKTP